MLLLSRVPAYLLPRLLGAVAVVSLVAAAHPQHPRGGRGAGGLGGRPAAALLNGC